MRHLLLATALALGLAMSPAAARVVEVQVLKTEPAFEGRAFGTVGTYEIVVTRMRLAFRAEEARNAGVVDLDRAPRNARGEIEVTTQVDLLRPTDLARGNGKIFYDVLNRGRKLGLFLMNDAPGTSHEAQAAGAGNGFLMEQGYTIVWSGWQGDFAGIPGLIAADVPIVPGIVGTSIEEFIFDNTAQPAIANLTYPAADLDPARARLTVRGRNHDARATPADLSFKYVNPTRIEITRPAGFDAGAIYEFIYPAKDPKVLGLGFAAVRDVVSFLRYEAGAADGGANPLAVAGRSTVQRAYALGISQSGRFLRDMLYLGFNEDEAGRLVFDAMIPHIAGSRKTFINYRFGQPGRAPSNHGSHFYPGDGFPFTYAVSADPLGKTTDGILKRCLASAAGCPKVMQTDTDTENMQARMSLVSTDAAGQHLDLPDNVRAYLLAGLPHFTMPGAMPGATPTCQLPSNPLHGGAVMRALVVALDQWVGEGVAPPANRYPSVRDGTLVAPKDAAYAGLPGLRYQAEVNRKTLVNHSTTPPSPGPDYPLFIARVDDDGHAVAAVRLPAISAPIATYLGWNLRKAGFAEGALCGLTGSTIPLAKTRAAREAAGDRRPSLEERYPTHGAYVSAVKAAAEQLVRDRLMLPADAARIVRDAGVADIGRPAD